MDYIWCIMRQPEFLWCLLIYKKHTYIYPRFYIHRLFCIKTATQYHTILFMYLYSTPSNEGFIKIFSPSPHFPVPFSIHSCIILCVNGDTIYFPCNLRHAIYALENNFFEIQVKNRRKNRRKSYKTEKPFLL